jgi:2-polyprenyl-3-methyl-5-hydroxy-6-metoxy-1,4-benzoquinol methylase
MNDPLNESKPSQPLEKHTSCLVCGSDRLKPLKGYYERHQMVKCRNCGFVFMERIPTAELLNRYYSTYAYGDESYLSPLTIKSYHVLLDEFEKYRKTNKILDAGCGRGWFLIEARKRGWEVYGTEYSSKAIELCEAEGIKMRQGELSPEMFDFSDFDVITSFEVMEHLNNPNKELQAITNLLRKGGLFYCTTPNFDSAIRYYLKADYNIIGYPEHLSYYTRSTLNRAAKNHGLKPVKFLSTGISITRFKTSNKTSTEQIISEESSDEKLRQNIDKKKYLGHLKNFANGLLTLTNSGMTLKGYYEKQ